MKQFLRVALATVVAFVLWTIPSLNAADEIIAIKAARLFDGKAKVLVPNGVVIVQGDKIVDAGSGLPIPQGARVIDLGDATLSPGFMDAHTHLTFDFSGSYQATILRDLQEDPAKKAYAAIPNARITLEAGFTTVRDVGAGDFIDVALRDAIAKGTFVGPRMLVAGKGVGVTGGHFDDANGFRDNLFGKQSDFTNGSRMDRMRSGGPSVTT